METCTEERDVQPLGRIRREKALRAAGGAVTGTLALDLLLRITDAGLESKAAFPGGG